jgi:hypothetical protein
VEHLLFTDGSDNMSSTSFEDICALVAKLGLPNYHLVVIGAGMSRSDQAVMQRLCTPRHCTFIPSSADLSQLSKLLKNYQTQVLYRMQLTVRHKNIQTTTRWQGKASEVSKAATQMLQIAPLLSEQMSGLLICADSGDRSNIKGKSKGDKCSGKGGKQTTSPLTWGVGTAVKVNGRKCVVIWDGRPDGHQFGMVEWADSGEKSGVIPASEIVLQVEHDWEVGTAAVVEGRKCVVIWDGRPEGHQFGMVEWADSGEKSEVIPANKICIEACRVG